MTFRLSIVGYGAVASIHARQLASLPDLVVTAVYGPDRRKAEAFATTHGIERFTDDLNAAVARSDAVIVASPSPRHFQQAQAGLHAGAHTLVELPPCERAADAATLARQAEASHRVLQCAHTSRFLAPYVRLGQLLGEGALGEIRQVGYSRHIAPRERSWTDDALLHHAAHPLDLLLDWFGDLLPLGCAALPRASPPQSVSLLGQLATGAPVTISISYASRLPHSRMVIVGDRHTVETDGFGYLHADVASWRIVCAGQSTYEAAIGRQDAEFVAACRGRQAGVAWSQTFRLMQLIDQFRTLIK